MVDTVDGAGNAATRNIAQVTTGGKSGAGGGGGGGKGGAKGNNKPQK